MTTPNAPRPDGAPRLTAAQHRALREMHNGNFEFGRGKGTLLRKIKAYYEWDGCKYSLTDLGRAALGLATEPPTTQPSAAKAGGDTTRKLWPVDSFDCIYCNNGKMTCVKIEHGIYVYRCKNCKSFIKGDWATFSPDVAQDGTTQDDPDPLPFDGGRDAGVPTPPAGDAAVSLAATHTPSLLLEIFDSRLKDYRELLENLKQHPNELGAKTAFSGACIMIASLVNDNAAAIRAALGIAPQQPATLSDNERDYWPECDNEQVIVVGSWDFCGEVHWDGSMFWISRGHLYVQAYAGGRYIIVRHVGKEETFLTEADLSFAAALRNARESEGR